MSVWYHWVSPCFWTVDPSSVCLPIVQDLPCPDLTKCLGVPIRAYACHGQEATRTSRDYYELSMSTTLVVELKFFCFLLNCFFFFTVRETCWVIGRMSQKKTTKQSSITSMGFPLLQKPTEMCVDRQIHVLGSYWTGCMSNEEVNSLYKCTVREYHALHKWDAGGSPSQSMGLQEMGVDGQGSRETGGSSADRIFFMKYPMSFLQHW